MTNRRHIGYSVNPLPDLPEVLFVQAPLTQCKDVSNVVTGDEIGTLLTLANRLGKVTSTKSDIVAAVAHHAQAVGAGATVLLDANRYSGPRRLRGTDGLAADYVAFQLKELRLPWALTDSGYVAAGDQEALESILRQAASLGPRVIAVLAVDSLWLRDASDQLRATIERYGVPVALALEHKGDPLSTRKTVSGLLHLMESDVSISNIRCDVSAAGALAAGSTFGTIGTTSGLRHVYPSKPGGGGGVAPGVSVLVPRCLKWVRQERLAEAIALTPGELYWSCACDICFGRRLDWLYGDYVYGHNLLAAAEIIRDLLAASDPLEAWGSACSQAQFANQDLEVTLGDGWSTPDYLGAWRHVVYTRPRV